MLDAMRRGVANLFAKLLLGLLLVAFAVWGVSDYIVRGPAQGGPLATVGKTQITVDDFKHAYQQEMQRAAVVAGGSEDDLRRVGLRAGPRTQAAIASLGLAA